MKSLIKKILAVVAAISLVTVGITSCTSSNQSGKSAKENSVATSVSFQFDSEIKTGALENGMTYFIKKNSEPQNRILLRLAIKAGSVMEEENERGVAHFIEHLAFNGTEHFEKNDIINWFEKIGMNFGGDLNAYTSFEETVYMLEIPADDSEMLKTAMLVLHDWASAITFPQEEIDRERGVIQEEWRMRTMGVSGRNSNQVVPFMTKDSVFENRMPIGKMDVINSITRDEILSFYKKWYRPEIMSVIVVGDAEVDTIENEIKTTMGTIPASENPITVTPNRIPYSAEKQIKIITDPEQQYPVVNIFEHNENIHPVRTEDDLRAYYIRAMAMSILNQRLREISSTGSSSWLDAAIGAANYNNSDFYVYIGVVPKEEMFIDSLKSLFDEYDRATNFGITDAELEQTKASNLVDLKNYLDNKDHIPSANIISNILGYYILEAADGMLSIENYYESSVNAIESITSNDINDFYKTTFKNRGTKFLALAPEGYADLPAEDELMEVWKNHQNKQIAEYVDDSIDKLMDKPAKKAKIKSQEKNKELGTTEYVLENGIKIITKKTDFKSDTILLQASSKGGTYQLNKEDVPSVYVTMSYMIQSGFNGCSINQLRRFLTDKSIKCNISVGNTSEVIDCLTTNKDLEYMLQFVNLIFTKRQFTDDAWKVVIDDAKMTAKNYGASPSDAFREKINEVLYGKDDAFHAPFDMAMYEKLNPAAAEKIANERLSNPADFTFVFVGDFDEKNLIELCQYYLGAMPTTPDREETKYIYWDFPKGKTTATVNKGIDEKGEIYMACGGELPPQKDMESGFKESVIAEQLGSLLEIRLREVIREDKSGAYAIGTRGMIDGYPERYYRFIINFNCQPEREEELAQAVLDTFKEIQTNGVSDENIQKLREAYRRTHETNLRENSWWMNKINAVSVFTYQPSWVVNDAEKVCSWITAEKLQEAAKKYLDTENYVCVFLKPE